MTEDLFAGTAEYYTRYRPRYPERLLRDIGGLAAASRREYLVDCGCGTGEVTMPLSSYFKRISAIDVDPEMVAAARRRAADAGVTNVDWKVGRAEEFPIDPVSCDLITAGSSFHWMDRELLSSRAHAGLRHGAALVIIGGGSSVWDESTEWHSIAVRCLREHLGEPRRAGSGTYAVTKRHGDYLVPAGFRLENRDYPTDHEWTADEIVGYLYSTSFASPSVLGDRKEAFERGLRWALTEANPNGTFREQLDFYLIIAHKD